MKTNYPKIFEPLTVKRMTIRNRIAMTPMGTNYGETSGEMSNRHMNYYSLRAKGGVGLIILENANVEYPVGSNGTSQIRIDHDSFMPRYYQLVENLHKNGAAVAIQINHAGASASSARTGMETVSSSNIPTKVGGEIPRPMTKEEIFTTVKKYGEAAKRVQAIGFDAVEIHCGHSYLMSQFISPYYNKRTDEFGGSVGLDVIEYFAPRGAECSIVDMLPAIGMMADPITKCSMRETHDKYGVKEYVNTALMEVKENAFVVKTPEGEIKELDFDLGFNCLGMRSNNPILPALEEAFADTDTYVYPIGDSIRARRIMEGTMEGRAILNVLESKGFLDLDEIR